MVGTGDGHACCWAWSACRVAPRWLVGRASRSPKRLALILRIDASSERKGVGSACVPRWRPPGAANGGICPKRDAADPEPEPARRPGDGAGGWYSEGENRRWGLVAVAADDTDRPSIAEDGGPRTGGEPDAAASGLELVRGGGARRSWSIAPDC